MSIKHLRYGWRLLALVALLLGGTAASAASGRAPSSDPANVTTALNNTPHACASLSFAPHADYAVGNGPNQVVAGDFNRDGAPDLATANASDNSVSTLQNNGNGSFGTAVNYAVGSSPLSLLVGLLDSNGDPDLVVSNSASHSIARLLGDGSGGFSTAVSYTTSNNPFVITSADFNRDGKLDVATISGNGAPSIEILLGDGAGGFTLFGTASPYPESQVIASADFNGDGNPDLIAASTHFSNVSIMLGNGDGTFQADHEFYVGANPTGLTIGDFNHDGKLDVATANFNGANVSVLLGNGDGTFQTVTNYPAAMQPQTIAVGDFNLDGNPDLATANYGANNVSILLGNGTGGFAAPQNFAVSAAPAALVAADLNGDGKPDLAVSQRYGNLVSVLLNTCTPDTPTPTVTGTPPTATDTPVPTDTPTTTPCPTFDIPDVCGTPTPPLTNTPTDTPFTTLTNTPTSTNTPGGPTATPTNTPIPPTQPPDPPPPYNLQVVASGQYTLTLTWEYYQQNLSFFVYRWDGSGFVRIGEVGLPPTYTDSNLACGTSYTYYVTSFDTYGGESQPSNEAIGTTQGCTTPTVTPTDCPNPFLDITGNVFYGAIHYLNCRGVINGSDSTHYSPAGTSTRGQFAKVVVLGFGLPFYTPTAPDFSDVPATYFAYLYIESGFHASILSGFDAQTCQQNGQPYPCYLPGRSITRGQLTKLVVNAARYPLYTPSSGPDFTDVPPSNVFYASIETAVHKGVVNGYPGGTFRPNDFVRRDEMAQIVYKGITTP